MVTERESLSESDAAYVDVVVVGGGMSGLAAAEALIEEGLTVQVIEAAPGVGGLGRSLSVGGEDIEAYYHHIFPQDRELRELVDRLGMSELLEWRPAPMGVLQSGRIYPFDSPISLLRFKPLPLFDRIRLGFGTVMALAAGRGRGLDGVSVSRAAPRWYGSKGYAVLWQPLLDGKFGPFAPDVAAPWLVSRIRQRANARKSGKGDRLGYLRGGLGTLARSYERELTGRGVRVSCGAAVDSITRQEDRWHISFGGREVSARAVVACLSGEALDGLAILPDAYRESLQAIPYRGIVCALIELDRPLGSFYWVNLVQKTDLACLAIIEHTNFIPAERYGGRHLVYLPHYVEVGGSAWNASLDQIVNAVDDALRVINPAFERSWIVGSHLSRDRWAQPVPLVGGPMPRLPIATGLPGLFHASLAHIYPDDRGVSLALGLGRRAAAETVLWLRETDAGQAAPGR